MYPQVGNTVKVKIAGRNTRRLVVQVADAKFEIGSLKLTVNVKKRVAPKSPPRTNNRFTKHKNRKRLIL